MTCDAETPVQPLPVSIFSQFTDVFLTSLISQHNLVGICYYSPLNTTVPSKGLDDSPLSSPKPSQQPISSPRSICQIQTCMRYSHALNSLSISHVLCPATLVPVQASSEVDNNPLPHIPQSPIFATIVNANRKLEVLELTPVPDLICYKSTSANPTKPILLLEFVALPLFIRYSISEK